MVSTEEEETILTVSEHAELEQAFHEFAQQTEPGSGAGATLLEPSTPLIRTIRTTRARGEECPVVFVDIPVDKLDQPVNVADFDAEYTNVISVDSFGADELTVSLTALRDLSPRFADFEDKLLDVFCDAYGFSRNTVERAYGADFYLRSTIAEDRVVKFMIMIDPNELKMTA